MKNIIKMGGILCLSLFLCACNNNDSAVSKLVNSQVDAANSVNMATEGKKEPKSTVDVRNERGAGTDNGTVDETNTAAETGTAAGGKETSALESGIDVDLTQMSSTMVYSEVYNIMTKPEDYVGKTIKIKGPYYASYWDMTDTYYHYVIIEDATECCTGGLEFIWDENSHSYPEEYPEDYTEIEIVGALGMYEEEGMTYCYLATNEIAVK